MVAFYTKTFIKETFMYCIIIAGMPGTGKTHFLNWLKEERKIIGFSKDNIKETLFDNIGFKSRAEKVKLGETALDLVYQFSEEIMRLKQPFIIENNFEDVSRDSIKALLDKHSYKPITVIFTTDYTTLYERSIARDRSGNRHRGHIINTVYPEIDETKITYPPLDEFTSALQARGFERFDIGGDRIVVDTTNFTNVDYGYINRQIDDVLK